MADCSSFRASLTSLLPKGFQKQDHKMFQFKIWRVFLTPCPMQILNFPKNIQNFIIFGKVVFGSNPEWGQIYHYDGCLVGDYIWPQAIKVLFPKYWKALKQMGTLARNESILNPLRANPTKWSNTFKQFVSCCRRIVWVCLTILWGWRLKG